jgi:Nucleotide-diphospho-sugar transferase
VRATGRSGNNYAGALSVGQRDEVLPNVVLAAAQDYTWQELRPFVESLLATGFRGEIRFFAPGVEAVTVGELVNAGVDISRPRRVRVKVGSRVFQPYDPRPTRIRWHVQPLYRHVVRGLTSLSPDRRTAAARLAGALSNVEVARYFWYFLYLSRTVSDYRNVMLTDVRDVVFLRDPFDFEVGESANFFLEDEKFTLAANVNNRGWLAGAYGLQALEELGGFPISCSGVTIGAAPAVLEYLEVMVDSLARLSRQFRGMDQGVHNYVVHKGLVPRARVVANTEGPVLTLGLMSPGEAATALRERAHQVNVVHQYDRHPEIAHTLARLIDAGR